MKEKSKREHGDDMHYIKQRGLKGGNNRVKACHLGLRRPCTLPD